MNRLVLAATAAFALATPALAQDEQSTLNIDFGRASGSIFAIGLNDNGEVAFAYKESGEYEDLDACISAGVEAVEYLTQNDVYSGFDIALENTCATENWGLTMTSSFGNERPLSVLRQTPR